MSTFRTEWSPRKPLERELKFSDTTVTTGSCFADRFGNWLYDNKFSVLQNPFGVSYNPVSIHHQLMLALGGERLRPNHVVTREGTFVHLDFHSDFRHTDEVSLVEQIKTTTENTGRFLNSASWLMITYGTAWVFDYLPTGCTINNCHKLPAKEFQKRLLAVDEIVASFERLHQQIIALRPDVHFLLTVSPVRHVKDTLEGNSVSKAVLRLAVDNIQRKFPDVGYFPAFEIMMDDLRDYRFYKDDLIHPNTLAENYLWQKFEHQFLANTTRMQIEEWQSIKKAIAHTPFEPTSAHHQRFLEALLVRLKNIAVALPVAAEVEAVERKLEALKNRSAKS